MRLSKDDILNAQDLVTEEVAVPEWAPEPGMDATVLVRGLTGRERDDYEASMIVRRGDKVAQDVANARAKLVVKCVVDDGGQRVFTDQDAPALGEKSAAALDRIFEVVARLSGLREEDAAEAEADFPPAPGGDSPTSSPSGSAAAYGVS